MFLLPVEPGSSDAVTTHNSYVALMLGIEGALGFAFWCIGMSHLVDWIDRRGWRPKDKQRKL